MIDIKCQYCPEDKDIISIGRISWRSGGFFSGMKAFCKLHEKEAWSEAKERNAVIGYWKAKGA